MINIVYLITGKTYLQGVQFHAKYPTMCKDNLLLGKRLIKYQPS